MEDQSVRVSGFLIHSQGDSSVGIPNGDWRLSGEFFFDSKDDVNDFRKALADVFEHVTDPKPTVITFEQYEYELYNEELAPHPDAPPEPLSPLEQQAHDLFPDNKKGGWEERHEQRLRREGAMKVFRSLEKASAT